MERNSFLKSNRGASLVLVSIFSVIVISLALSLVALSSMLLSDAGSVKKYNQAYELATGLYTRIDELILNELVIDETTHQAYKSQIDLDQYISNNGGEIVPLTTGFDSVPDSSVSAVVNEKTESGSTVYVLTVKATAAGETYIITAEYTGNASAGYDRK